ncbi:MAG: ABC transporter permease [Paludibacteraceae bacterium]
MFYKNLYQLFQQTLRRELLRMVSRPIYLVGTFGVMIFCFVFFTTLLKEGMPNKMPIATVDLDQSWVSRALIKNLDATQQAKVAMHLGSYTEARREMQKGNIYGFLVIKNNLEADAIAGRRPTITFYINDGYLVAGSLVMKDITYLSELGSGALNQAVLRKKGMPEEQIMSEIQPKCHRYAFTWQSVDKLRGVFNQLTSPGGDATDDNNDDYFCHKRVELKEKTSHVWLENAGNNMFVALTGKLLPYTFIFTLLALFSNVLLYRYLHFPLNTSIGWMFLASFLFVLAYQAIGVFIIGLVPVLRDGVAIAAFYGLLGFTFAGFTFPIEQMVSNIQIFSYLFPIRYYFEVYASQALLGAPVHYVAAYFIALLTFLALPFLVFMRLKKAAVTQKYPAH